MLEEWAGNAVNANALYAKPAWWNALVVLFTVKADGAQTGKDREALAAVVALILQGFQTKSPAKRNPRTKRWEL